MAILILLSMIIGYLVSNIVLYVKSKHNNVQLDNDNAILYFNGAIAKDIMTPKNDVEIGFIKNIFLLYMMRMSLL